jgi:glucose/arabinose dehydrogenase
VLASGLASPLFATHANDGTHRMYIVERAGVVRVLAPGASAATPFLDIRSRVVAGGEQGLLGLAFHPQYATNGRLFVFYTRAGDGALVVAEHRRSLDPNVADPAQTVLLAIPHPGQTNHNGGMLAFGPDGYLYVGTGDGGGSNDPQQNAQNAGSLLGKVLRIDVDRDDPGAGTPYAAPPDNPFVGAMGRDEIFAIGLRNPWRFSFDRETGQLWLGDVGQESREEVNAPVVAGGNYGWRVYEGTVCTGLEPQRCTPATFTPPRFEYAHTQGRCSITGGYVYRGTLGTLAPGTYVYGDFCSGEILAWNGTAQRVLLDTGMELASFGEDERGELYVVDLRGAVYRLAADTPLAVEYYNAGFGHYFTTALGNEILLLDAGVFAGWERTGGSFRVLPANTPDAANVCRFFSTGFAPKSSHFYTPVAQECATVRGNPLWDFEGEVYALALPGPGGECPLDTLHLYRLYNDGQGGAPNHRYTTSPAVRTEMIAAGWIPEGLGVGVIGCVPE